MHNNDNASASKVHLEESAVLRNLSSRKSAKFLRFFSLDEDHGTSMNNKMV